MFLNVRVLGISRNRWFCSITGSKRRKKKHSRDVLATALGVVALHGWERLWEQALFCAVATGAPASG